LFVFISHLTVAPEDQIALERHFRQRSRPADELAESLRVTLAVLGEQLSAEEASTVGVCVEAALVRLQGAQA
jgi:hypothetical protein